MRSSSSGFREGDQIDADKLEVYAGTVLEIGEAPAILVDLSCRVDENLIRQLTERVAAATFTVITAENPYGVPAHDGDARTRRLRRILDREHLPWVPALGRNAAGSHREQGFAVPGAMKPVLNLARTFEQDAVFRFESRSFWLIAVRSGHMYQLTLNQSS